MNSIWRWSEERGKNPAKSRSICWSLIRNGLHGRMAVKKLFLSNGNRDKKLEVCKIIQELDWNWVATGLISLISNNDERIYRREVSLPTRRSTTFLGVNIMRTSRYLTTHYWQRRLSSACCSSASWGEWVFWHPSCAPSRATWLVASLYDTEAALPWWMPPAGS